MGIFKITLPEDEIKRAEKEGRKRYENAVALQWEGTEGEPLRLDWHLRGARCECAFAKWGHLPWDGNFGKLDIPDVDRYEVRGIWKAEHKLYINKRDKEKNKLHRPFILVFEKPPVFEMVGWIYGKDGLREEWFSTPYPNRPPVWWVPRENLNPMETLPGVKLDEWCDHCALTPGMASLGLCEYMKIVPCKKLAEEG